MLPEQAVLPPTAYFVPGQNIPLKVPIFNEMQWHVWPLGESWCCYGHAVVSFGPLTRRMILLALKGHCRIMCMVYCAEKTVHHLKLKGGIAPLRKTEVHVNPNSCRYVCIGGVDAAEVLPAEDARSPHKNCSRCTLSPRWIDSLSCGADATCRGSP